MSDSRPLPQSLDAERMVLGGIFIDPEQIVELADFLQPDHFFDARHKKLFGLMLGMQRDTEPIELEGVIDKITAAGNADEYGGVAYVASLADRVPASMALDVYAKRVVERAVARQLLQGLREIDAKVRDSEVDLESVLGFAQATVFELSQSRGGAEWSRLSILIDEQIKNLHERANSPGEVTGIPTGFIDLDKILAGMQRTDMLVLAARPSMGKTALALNIAQYAAEQGVGVGVFSLEMGRQQLAARLMCSTARVPADKLRSGHLSRERDWPAIIDAGDHLYRLPLFIVDTPALSSTQIRSKARRLKSEYPGLGLIVIDGIWLMGADNPSYSREQQVASASRGLKAMAKELDVAVLALHQLNRGVEQRDNKRPRLSDLRESGAIEQDADVIMFIYRDDYYNKEKSSEPGVAEILIEKHRNGATGMVKLHFEGKFTRFENHTPREEPYL